jgi:hypothetical protein
LQAVVECYHQAISTELFPFRNAIAHRAGYG